MANRTPVVAPREPVATCDGFDIIAPVTPGLHGTGTRGAPVKIEVRSGNSTQDISKALVFVRGCRSLELRPINLNPPDAPVAWQVFATGSNQNASLTLTDKGTFQLLSTTQTGAFVVGLTVNEKTKFSFPIILAGVDPVLPPTALVAQANFKAHADNVLAGGQGPATIMVKSGTFFSKAEQNGLGSATATGHCFFFDALVNVKAETSAAVKKITVSVLQNEMADDSKAFYQNDDQEKLTPKPGKQFPFIDAQNAGLTFLKFSSDMSNIGVNSSQGGTPAVDQWRIQMCDSPATAFPINHFKNTKNEIRSLAGGQRFRTAIAAFSADAPSSFVVCAFLGWSVDYSGKVEAPATWTPFTASGAHTVPFQLAPNGGQDAADAGFQVMPPIAFDPNRGTIDWDPPPP